MISTSVADPFRQPVLVLGASGFIGSHLTRALLSQRWPVRAFSRRFDPEQVERLGPAELLEIHEASVFDEQALINALDGVSVVVNLLGFSVPSTSPNALQSEISTTLQANNLILSAMAESGARRLVFPSSGGTIYGEIGPRAASEDDPPAPLVSYGLGKLVCEEMIRFYSRIYGINYLILRISNPYGAARIRRVSQGVIDVFLEQIQSGQPLNIWGSLETVRDYIFVDDLMEVFLKLLWTDVEQSQTLNVGSGKGTTLREVLRVIAEVTGHEPTVRISEDKLAGVTYSRLDTKRLHALIDWAPRYSIESGIHETWRRKQQLL